MDIDYYKAIHGGVNARSDREITEHYAKRRLNWDLPQSIAYEDEVLINGKQQPLIITQTKDEYIYNIEALPYQSFKIGDEIVWQDSHWLVVKKYRGTKYQELGSIEKCNHLLHWLDFQHKLCECWCIVGDEYTRYNRDNTTINQAVDELTLKVPDNEKTQSIFIGKRISIGKGFDHLGQPILIVHKIASRRNITLDLDGNNVIRMTMNRDVYNSHTDNYDLDVCDYFVPDGSVKERIGRTDIYGKTFYRLSGGSRQYAGTFYDGDDNKIAGVVPVWSVEVDSEYEKYVSYTVDNGVLNLTVARNDAMIGATIRVILDDEDESFPEAIKTVEVVE